MVGLRRMRTQEGREVLARARGHKLALADDKDYQRVVRVEERILGLR